MEIRGFVNNITNRRYVTYVNNLGGTTARSGFLGTPGQRRQFGVNVTSRF